MSTDQRTMRMNGPDGSGGAVGRDVDGRVTFVEGALPGELVTVEITDARKRFARGHLVAVDDASADRVEPPCRFVAAGCGGCDQQHAALTLQRAMKEQSVVDVLERIGGVAAPSVSTVTLSADAFRTTVRAGVDGDRAGYRARRSHDLVAPDACLVAHPLVEELLVDGRFRGCREVTIRVGARTGERMVLGAPNARRVEVPDDVVVVGENEVQRGREAAIHEAVAGRTWRISARSFFQSRPDGADALVDVVRSSVERLVPEGVDRLVDLYAGVGLFAGSVPARRATAVESSSSSVGDARHNLGEAVYVTPAPVEEWRSRPADVVIADPSREGLGAAGAERVVETQAALVVLVSCDAGSLGRDAGALGAAGYELESTTLIDIFPHTHHVEVVTTFVRR